MERALCPQSVLSKVVAVVGRKHNQSLVGQSAVVERLQDAADLLVHEAGHAVINRHVFARLLFINEMRAHPVNAETTFAPG